jgi:hypothetical protein
MKDNKANSKIIVMAKKDLAALEGMIDDTTHFSDEVFGFHAEQAVEKALKAWISALGEQYPFTHDLSLLLNQLKKLDVDISEWLELLELSSFGVQFRYEEVDLDGEPLDRAVILSKVTHLICNVDTAITKQGTY